MNRAKIVVLAVVAVTLAACSGAPSWNEAVFPNQPEYNVSVTEYGVGNTHMAKLESPGE